MQPSGLPFARSGFQYLSSASHTGFQYCAVDSMTTSSASFSSSHVASVRSCTGLLPDILRPNWNSPSSSTVGHHYSQRLFMDINPRLWGIVPPGRERRAGCGYFSHGRGLSPLPQGTTTTPNYLLKHARSGSDSHTASTSPMSVRPRRSGPLLNSGQFS